MATCGGRWGVVGACFCLFGNRSVPNGLPTNQRVRLAFGGEADLSAAGKTSRFFALLCGARLQLEDDFCRDMDADPSLRSLSMERFSGDDARCKYGADVAKAADGDGSGLRWGSGDVCRVWRQEV
ncbi:hypothetical protein GQ53DRAFT_763530 [Thozetella sp. PMI_491]|nr:hypothetical protein GQ53DRAFT_763530 [Thozetella sp. PMI_491]